jgi:hypothetical protein
MKKIFDFIVRQKILIISLCFVFSLCLFFLFKENIEKNKQVFIMNVLLNLKPNNLHNIGTSGNVVKYDKSGKLEFVLNEKGNTISNDLINGAMVNYFSIYEPLEHFFADILPYLKYDKNNFGLTTKQERVNTYMQDFFESLDFLRNRWGIRITNISYFLKNNKDKMDFFTEIFTHEEFKNYKFNERDEWFKNEKRYLEFKNDIKKYLVKKI